MTESDDNWELLLTKMVADLGARSARVLELNAAADTVKNSIVVNHDSVYIDQYVAHYVNLCPWRPELAKLPTGQLYSTYLDFSCDQKSFYQTEFYNDWAKPQDIAHGLCGTIFKGSDSTVQLMFQRTHGQAYFTVDEQRQMNFVLPYIGRALDLKRQFSLMQQESQVQARAASTSVLPFISLYSSGRVQYCSPELEEILPDYGSYLTVTSGVVRFASLTYQAQWDSFFESGDAAPTIGVIPLGLEDGRQLSIKITRLPEGLRTVRFLEAPSPLVVAYFFTPSEIHLDLAYLALAYSITPAESRILVSMVNGASLRAISRVFSSSLNTVRTHSKSIFKKTKTHSQSELISLVLRGPANLKASD